ncbi:gliding motility-associated C-terminal domain-containing protein [Thermaurantimonas aggregans]|uniref:T9SS type B sorting domain-containing protein n=1 Tax=Thermaurantimonas aggregans TaxID=2173829 RepID=UPI0023F37D17|nr:gliding motility-associated C-terminal domain-containing protein [Thermaurantimonas aggregans]MCX8147997.1 gliding motility-associated C-terminal domain-containing protein [Thermaurantimonas aggregans]
MLRFFAGLILYSFVLHGTHNRAGEITYRHISGLTYEITITTYTKESSVAADRCSLTVWWGDNTTSVLNRLNGPTNLNCGPGIGMGVSLANANDVKLNIYRGTHTYPSAGIYTISMEDPNRNGGVSNIPGSISVPFYIQSVLIINPILGPNNSVTLLNPPIDDACLNQPYIHNPGAFDQDGDSLAFTLVNCRGAGGVEFQTTYAPNLVQDPVSIDPVKGDFQWNIPKNQGQYNFAILISEFRKTASGQWALIGQVTRDLQITVGPCNNKPPVIPPVGPFCVIAGQTLQFSVAAFDPDFRNVTLTATGGPFVLPPPATMLGASTDSASVTRIFRWTTSCNHVRPQPYQVFFRAEDQPSNPFENPLSAYMTTDIVVIGPPPQNLQAVGTAGRIELSWNLYSCSDMVKRYKIYRREGPSGFTPDSCQTGLPPSTGFALIGFSDGSQATSYMDSLVPKMGVKYCYRIVAEFENGAESIASNEACSEVVRTAPVLTNVDVENTSQTQGIIHIRWTPPKEIDTSNFPPPYSYRLYRTIGIDGSDFQPVKDFSSFIDTVFTDSLLNTEGLLYRYTVDFLSGQNQKVVGRAYPATQPFLELTPSNRALRLSYQYDGPWQNDSFVVYRREAGSITFDSIGLSTEPSYLDTGLTNGSSYCYYIKTIGAFTGAGMPAPILNRSQIACGVPMDTALPCPPRVKVDYRCEEKYLEFQFTFNDTGSCPTDVNFLYYNMYFKNRKSDEYPTTPSVSNITQPTYQLQNMNLSGCYAFTVVTVNPQDPAQPTKESRKSPDICLSPCPEIQMPNVFTPNSDGQNDLLLPIKWSDVLSGTITIFNRWGQIVYLSEANVFAEKGWDGIDQSSGRPCPEGTYFYTIAVQINTEDGPQPVDFKGNITLFR